MPSTFADLGTPPDITAALSARGITSPFPIQAATLIDSCAGRDLAARAPTGSGKTLAFGIPIAMRAERARPRNPTVLVLVPTRELAAQVCDELEWLGAPRGLRVASCYGGVGIGPQRSALRRGVDVLVACPGRLTDLVERGDVVLAEVGIVVLDEADRMADMGFLPAVRKLLDLTPSDRQTMLFSATLGGAVTELWRRYQRNPARHTVERPRDTHPRARHHFWKTERADRLRVCAEVIEASGPTIVFCRTKRGADQVARQLSRAGIEIAIIHGNRSQSQRERALSAFKGGAVDALIATDVAARGIHVDDVACVVHYDPPAEVDSYSHRSGRTARAGASGTVISLVAPEQKSDVARLQRALGHAAGLTPPDLEALTPAVGGEAPDTGSASPDRVDRAPEEESGARVTGTVKWFDRQKGFGFISRQDADEVFVHFSAIEGPGYRSLDQGAHVEFEVRPGRKGDEARSVRVA